MDDAFYVGVDLGGTNIKAGVTDGDGRLRVKASIPTEAEGGSDHVIERMASLALDVIKRSGRPRDAFAGVGIGSPGPLSHRRGVVFKPANLPKWNNVPVTELMRARLGMPAVLENDGNAAALGEYWVGAGRDVRDMVMFTLGTGVGAGVICDGRLLRGAHENAGELGHIVVEPDGPPCNCGQKGCLETYTSAGYVAQRAREAIDAGAPSVLKARLDAGEPVECEHVERAALEGDALAARIWDEAAQYLAFACICVQHFANPQCVVFAGGMAAAGDTLLRPIRKYLDQRTWTLVDDKPELRLATLGNDAGLIGAAASVWLARQVGELE